MKNISTINPAITEITECLIVKAHASAVDIKVGVPLKHDVFLKTSTWCITMLHFATSSSNVWLTFQAKNNVRSVPANTALP